MVPRRLSGKACLSALVIASPRDQRHDGGAINVQRDLIGVAREVYALVLRAPEMAEVPA